MEIQDLMHYFGAALGVGGGLWGIARFIFALSEKVDRAQLEAAILPLRERSDAADNVMNERMAKVETELKLIAQAAEHDRRTMAASVDALRSIIEERFAALENLINTQNAARGR